MGRRFMVRCILGGVALAAVSTLTACGGSDPALGAAAASNPGEDGARDLVRGALRSPASYIEYSNKVVWSGASSDGNDAYIVEVDYEATNGFGGSIRDCKSVAFFTEKGKPDNLRFYPNRYMDACAKNSGFDEELYLKAIKESNFGVK